MDLRLIPGALLAVGLLAGCGGAQTAGEASTAATTPASSAPAASVPASAGLIAASAAACDEVNRLTSRTDALTHTQSYAYDKVGNRTQATDAANVADLAPLVDDPAQGHVDGDAVVEHHHVLAHQRKLGSQ